MECHRIPSQASHWEPDGFRRRPGRPRQNWRGVISKDLNSQEDRDQMGRSTGGIGGQEKLADSCRPVRLRRLMNQEPGTHRQRKVFPKRLTIQWIILPSHE